MKILVLCRYGRLGASSRLRMMQYIPYLQRSGLQCDAAPLLDDHYLQRLYENRSRSMVDIFKAYINRIITLMDSGAYDSMWVEKELFPMLPAWFEKALLRSMPCIVDYDDAVFHNYDRHGRWIVRAALKGKIDAIMKCATAVVVGNDYLAERAVRAGAARTHIIPTVVDLERYSITSQARDAEEFVVGWVGTMTTAKYPLQIAEALQRLSKYCRCRLLVVGVRELMIPGVTVETFDWCEDSEAELIGRMNVGIMPLKDDYWERGKCGYKLIQYMAMGKPVVASPVGVNNHIVINEKNGFLAETLQDWEDALMTLACDSQLARRMGSAGRVLVESDYSLQVMAPRMLKIIGDAVEKDRLRGRSVSC